MRYLARTPEEFAELHGDKFCFRGSIDGVQYEKALQTLKEGTFMGPESGFYWWEYSEMWELVLSNAVGENGEVLYEDEEGIWAK